MKKKSPKLVAALVAVLTLANVFSLTGCGKTESTGSQADQKVQIHISETEQEITSAQTDVDTAQTQTDEQGVGTGGMMRAYSDKEKERMADLQQSYQNETAKPGKMIQEVGSAEEVTEGTLCYIISTGEYYLSDRELSDEELLEIIDCNFRIAVAHSGVSEEEKAKYLAEIARLEKIVQDNDGISVDEAVEIARKKLKADLGDAAATMELMTYDDGSGAGIFDTTDEAYEGIDSKADVAYDVGFGNPDTHDTYSYIIDAVDGRILYAYH